jgi:UDP-GlcNAc3NAcA epimerase
MVEHASMDVTIVNTGQHYDDNMLGGFLRELDVPKPHVDLDVGSADAVLQTAMVMQRLGQFLAERRPDCVCVFGDTNSTLAAGLAAVKAGIPLVHVEAGCRSFDMRMPEEVNRRVVDHISSLLLPVSPVGAENLRREAVLGSIEVVGDPQFDVFSRQTQQFTGAARTRGLITIHRPENADDPERLRLVLEEIAATEAEVDWMFPIHPRTRRSLGPVPPEISLCEPLLYAQLLEALFEARICVTDSGGLQKEAFWARVPCVTVRPTTEWMETVDAGANVLAQPGDNLMSAVASSLELTLDESYENPYGDGHGSEQIINAIMRWRERGAIGWEPGTS